MFAKLFDCSVAHLAELCPWFFEGLDCVIAAVDSSPKTVDVVERLLGAPLRRHVDGKALLSGSALLTLAPKLFYGFDEVCVFEPGARIPAHAAIWDEVWTSERLSRAPQDVPKPIEDLLVNGAIRFASDGDGLFVVSHKESDLVGISAALGQ